MRIEKYLFLAGQLLLVVLTAQVYHVEEMYGFLQIVPFLFFGFLVHFWLPEAWRLPFFVALSLAGLVYLLGFPHSIGVIGLGMLLIALCHLPIPFFWRVALIVTVAAGLAVFRAGWVVIPGWEAFPTVVLPLLAGMFMFRMILFLHDLRHEREPATLWHRLGYFFLLPNICCPLFPVVDYQAFRRSHYRGEDETGIYQKGIVRMFRGVTHLLLYRVIYLYVVPDPAGVNGLGTLIPYVLGTYLLYLRISGLFHLSVGSLALFGFDLPPVFRRFLLAESFTDLWRRANIYWKDFMVKVFYFPAFMRLRAFGVVPALVGSVLVVFAATWVLHIYQGFWLRGELYLGATDFLFWAIMGALVVVNVLSELRSGRAVPAPGFVFRRALQRSARVVGTLGAVAVLWTLWSSLSVSEFVDVMGRGLRSGAGAYVLLLLGVLALLLAGVGVQWLGSRGVTFGFDEEGAATPRAGIATALGALVLLAVSVPALWRPFGPSFDDTMAAFRKDRFNQRDVELANRGYYERLLAPGRYAAELWQVQGRRPGDWQKTIVQAGAGRYTGNLLRYELKPSTEVLFKRAWLRTNRWGMRDRDYERHKPPGTFRIALVGASNEMGWGVENDELYEAVAEELLNRVDHPGRHERYEILNFAVTGYTLLQALLVVEEKVGRFEPDVMVFRNLSDPEVLVSMLALRIQKGDDLYYRYLDELVERAGVTPGMSRDVIAKRLRPYADHIIVWAYQRMSKVCRERGILPVWMYVPPVPGKREHSGVKDPGIWREAAEKAGFITISLESAFEGIDPWNYWLAPWDAHANALAHRRLGEKLFEVLLAHSDTLKLFRE